MLGGDCLCSSRPVETDRDYARRAMDSRLFNHPHGRKADVIATVRD